MPIDHSISKLFVLEDMILINYFPLMENGIFSSQSNFRNPNFLSLT